MRLEGDWEAWIAIFLEGVASVAEEAITTVRRIFDLVNADRTRVLSAASTSLTSLRLLEELPRHPVVTVGRVTRLLDTTKPTASKAVSALEELGILTERTGRLRDRTFGYEAYLGILREDGDSVG